MHLSRIDSIILASLTLKEAMLTLSNCSRCECKECNKLHPKCQSFLEKKIIVNPITGVYTSTALISLSTHFLEHSGGSEYNSVALHLIATSQIDFLNKYYKDSAPSGIWFYLEDKKSPVLDSEKIFSNYAQPNIYKLLDLVLQARKNHPDRYSSIINSPTQITKPIVADFCLYVLCGLPTDKPSIFRTDVDAIDIESESSETENINDTPSSDTSDNMSPDDIKDEDYQEDNDRSPPDTVENVSEGEPKDENSQEGNNPESPHIEEHLPLKDVELENFQEDNDPPLNS
jgi:hypothetical protein